MSNTVSELARYNRIRQEAISKLGGKCISCGIESSLEFDHINPDTKEYAVSDIWSIPKLFWKEIAKCQLLCTDCHKTKTSNERYKVSHGGGACGKHECKCIPCRARKREYNHNVYKRPPRFS